MLNFGKKPLKDKTITECTKLVESFLKKAGLNSQELRLKTENGASWHLVYGSAMVYISAMENKQGSLLHVFSPIVYLPENNILPFYRRCLELNQSMINTSISIMDNTVYVRSSRYTAGLDPEELEEIVMLVSQYADLYDNELSEEFGAKMVSENENIG